MAISDYIKKQKKPQDTTATAVQSVLPSATTGLLRSSQSQPAPKALQFSVNPQSPSSFALSTRTGTGTQTSTPKAKVATPEYVGGFIAAPRQEEVKQLSLSVNPEKPSTKMEVPKVTQTSTPQTVSQGSLSTPTKIANKVSGAITGGVMTVAESLDRFVKSALEAPENLIRGGGDATITKRVTDTVLPGLESIQDLNRKYLEEGDSPGLALAKATGQLAVDEPVGFAFKPVFFLGGLLFKGAISKMAAPAAETMFEAVAKSNSADDIASILTKSTGVADDQAKVLAQELVEVKTPQAVQEFFKNSNDMVERGFVTSVKEAIPEVGTKAHGTYIPRPTDPLAIKARNLVNDNILLAEKMAKDDRLTDETVAVTMELIKKYSDDAAQATDEATRNLLYDRVAEITNEIAPKLTEAGRTVQAAAILSRMTPEGQVRFAARQILKWNEKNPGKMIPNLDGKTAAYIMDEMNQIQKMPDTIDRAVRFKKLQDYVTDLVPTPWWKKILTTWKAGLLTGIKTSGLNIFSNASHAATEIAKDAPATVVDTVASLFTGTRTKAFTVKGYGIGTKEGFEKGWQFLKTGVDEREILAKLDYNRVNFGTGPVAKFFQMYTDSVFRVLGAEDQVFYYGAAARSIAEQARVSGINKGLRGAELAKYADDLMQNPTEDMVMMAISDARVAVFSNETALGRVAKDIQNLGDGAGGFVLPFGRTPAAVATQIINYTPVGTVIEIVKQISKKQFNQKAFSEAVGRGLTGTGVAYVGYKLMEKGLVTLDYPTTERDREEFKLDGRKPNTVLIDGKWRSPMVLGPAGSVLLFGAHIKNAYDESGSITGAGIKGMLGSWKSFTEQTFMVGINQFIGALTDPERNAVSFVAGLVGSVIPTIVNDIAKATDDYERRTADPSDVQTIINRIQSRIPMMREDLQPVVDALGNKQERIGNPIEVMLDPTRPSPVKSTPLIEELKRLKSVGHDVSPTMIGDKTGYDVLSAEENTMLWTRTGMLIRKKLEGLIANPAYKEADDGIKEEIVDDFITRAKDEARAQYIYEKTRYMSSAEAKKTLSAYKADELLTAPVFRELERIRGENSAFGY